jgi:hypothetical protein
MKDALPRIRQALDRHSTELGAMRHCLRTDTLADYHATYCTAYDGIRKVSKAGKPVTPLTCALLMLRPDAALLLLAASVDATSGRQPRVLDAGWLPSVLQSVTRTRSTRHPSELPPPLQ